MEKINKTEIVVAVIVVAAVGAFALYRMIGIAPETANPPFTTATSAPERTATRTEMLQSLAATTTPAGNSSAEQKVLKSLSAPAAPTTPTESKQTQDILKTLQ